MAGEGAGSPSLRRHVERYVRRLSSWRLVGKTMRKQMIVVARRAARHCRGLWPWQPTRASDRNPSTVFHLPLPFLSSFGCRTTTPIWTRRMAMGSRRWPTSPVNASYHLQPTMNRLHLSSSKRLWRRGSRSSFCPEPRMPSIQVVLLHLLISS